MGENKQQTGPESAAAQNETRRTAKKKRRPARHSVRTAPLPAKPVFAPVREAELLQVFRHARDNFARWAFELVQGEPRLYDSTIKICYGVIKYYVGFEYDMPETELSREVMKKIQRTFFDATVETKVQGMPGQKETWYKELLYKSYKDDVIVEIREARAARLLTRRQLLESLFAEAEVEIIAWATEFVKGEGKRSHRRLSEATTQLALTAFQAYLGLRPKGSEAKFSTETFTMLHGLLRRLTKEYNLTNLPGQKTNEHHQFLREELGYSKAS